MPPAFNAEILDWHLLLVFGFCGRVHPVPGTSISMEFRLSHIFINCQLPYFVLTMFCRTLHAKVTVATRSDSCCTVNWSTCQGLLSIPKAILYPRSSPYLFYSIKPSVWETCLYKRRVSSIRALGEMCFLPRWRRAVEVCLYWCIVALEIQWTHPISNHIPQVALIKDLWVRPRPTCCLY